MSTFSGKLKEFPHISVDRFDGRNLASTAYFLSHAHSDHMVGLSSPHFLDHLESNSGVYLYCSVITARFLQASIRHRPLSPFLKPLPVNEEIQVTIPTVDNEPHHTISVTLIPAGHCPGSVMILFEGRSGTVLYTGDFRIEVGESSSLKALHNVDGTIKTINSLHIDTTFCNRRVVSFPNRQNSAQAVIDLIEEWLSRGNNHIIHLQCPAKYGYEFLYRSVHERFNMKIHVNRWKYRMYDTVPEIQENLTTDATETWIHACDSRPDDSSNINTSFSSESLTVDGKRATKRHLPCRCVPYGVDTEPNIRVIKPSAQFFSFNQSHQQDICLVSEGGAFCRVLLSMHASCSEILDMVAYLRPRKVYPNVIPTHSSKEEVLSLLHEALSQSGDHYSIEYDGRNELNHSMSVSNNNLGSFQKQMLSSLASTSNLSAEEEEEKSRYLTSLKRQFPLCSYSSLNKKRRHSDSGSAKQDALLLSLPNPRGNMKGSISLEGENPPLQNTPVRESHLVVPSQHDGGNNSESTSCNSSSPYSSSPMSSTTPTPISPTLLNGTKSFPSDSLISSTTTDDNGDDGLNFPNALRKSDSESSSVFSDDSDALRNAERDDSALDLTLSRNQNTLAKNLSVMSDGGDNLRSVTDTRAKKRRKMWYKHQHFSTPVTDDVSVNDITKSNKLPQRASSLPDPGTLQLANTAISVSSSHLQSTPNLNAEAPSVVLAPLITVSSPCESGGDSKRLATDYKQENRVSELHKCRHQKLLKHVSAENVQAVELEEFNISGIRPSVIKTIIGSSSVSNPLDSGSDFNHGSLPRSSCLKTARRTGSDVLEVISLEHAKSQ